MINRYECNNVKLHLYHTINEDGSEGPVDKARLMVGGENGFSTVISFQDLIDIASVISAAAMANSSDI